jgi:type IV pilus assembly protein PilB
MLTDILLKNGQINQTQFAQIQEEIKKTQKKEEEILLEKKIMPEKSLFKLKSEILNIPLEDLVENDMSNKALDFIPEDTAKSYKILPVSFDNNNLKIGTPFPEDFSIQQTIRFLARQHNISTTVFLITLSDFNNCFKKYKKIKQETHVDLKGIEISPDEERQIFSIKIEEIEKDAPTVIKLVSKILIDAIEKKATDIHIEPLAERARVRFRLDGMLREVLAIPSNLHPAVVGRFKILSKLKIDETRIPQDGRFSGKISNLDVDFRIATLPTPLGEKIAIRVLDPTRGRQTIEELGIFTESLDLIKKYLKTPHGIILVTGPTGCGKSTTLYTFLSYINNPQLNIITLEDPIEYKYEGINQSQIKAEIGYTFATGLRQILRQDPNIIMIGEIRDAETAGLAIQAALTGHLVFSTLHTNSAAGVAQRLVDLEVNRFLIASTLRLMISQRLIRKLCTSCKIKKPASLEDKEIIEQELKKIPDNYKEKYKEKIKETPLSLYYPQGCKRCGETGFQGRIGIFEIIETTENIRDLILKNPTESAIWEEAKKQNMVTVFQSGILQTLNEVVSLQEVLRVSQAEKNNNS